MKMFNHQKKSIMKKNIIALLMLLFFAESFCQTPVGPTFSKDYFLQRSKNQNTAAWILLCTGTTAVITGVIIDNSNKGNVQSYTGGYIEIGGIVCTLISIPYFFSAAHNRRKAVSLTLINDQILMPQKHAIALISMPSVSLRIKF